jgi:hypothetical protein
MGMLLSQKYDPAAALTLFEQQSRTTAISLHGGALRVICVLLLRHNDLEEAITEARETVKRDPYDETVIYQELLAEHKLKHIAKISALVKQLQATKAHNQQAKTKYVLEEAQYSASPQ